MANRQQNQLSITILIVLVIISGTGLASIILLNTNLGTLTVSTITIPSNNFRQSGLLYKPNNASESNPLPLVICAHGFSGSKASTSGIALEISRRGFVALSLDLSGHGNSDLLIDDPTLGIMSAIDYFESIPYVNSSLIGVVGHSMGAEAAQATALAHGNITSTILLGPVGIAPNATILKEFNATFPRNLMIAIGEYDEFYSDVKQLETVLMPIFGTFSPIVSNYAFYGSFSIGDQDTRRLVISKTNHILETADPKIVSEVVGWIQNSFKPFGKGGDTNLSQSELIYTYREIASLVTLISIIGLIFPLISIFYNYSHFAREKELINFDGIELSLFKTGLIWGGLLIVLCIPISIVGSIIPIFPLTFSASLGFWLLLVNICLFLGLVIYPKFFGLSLDLRNFVLTNYRNLWTRNGIILASIAVFVLFIIMWIFSTFLSLQLGFVLGVFSIPTNIERIISFILIFPILLVYFLIDGLIFHGFNNKKNLYADLRIELLNTGKLLLLKSWPFLAVTIPIYLGRILLGIHLLPETQIALLFQFYWVIGIFLLGGTIMSYLWYRFSYSITPGVVFNSLLFTWMFCGILPIA